MSENELEKCIADLETKISRLENDETVSEFYMTNMKNALASVKEGNSASALKFLITVLTETYK